MKNFITRTLSGAVYVALIIASILISKYTFAAFFAILLLVGMGEFNNLTATGKRQPIAQVIDMLLGLAVFLGTFAITNDNIDIAPVAISITSCVIARLVTGLYLKEESPIKSWAYSFFNVMYVAVPLAMLSVIYSFLPYLALFMFAMIWINDTGAFLVGCTIGKHRMFPRISPKKSWEGFFGGFVFCILCGIAINYVMNYDNWLQWALFGAIASAFATWGDLVESLIKRTIGVKDSGNIMPGHGGILDRIDSLLLVTPAILVYLLILRLI